MNKRVYIIHGWSDNPESGWFPWLKNELKAKGYQVFVPAMPDTDAPDIAKWVGYLAELVGKPDENTYFVGHSIGCQTIMRYLQGLNPGAKVGGVVFVAGWFQLQNLNEEEKVVAKPWLETPIDFAKIREAVGENITVLLSDNDPFGALEKNKKIFENKLHAKIILLHKKGHICEYDRIKKLPEVAGLF
ncbi:MAG: alpha/beta fold hydrolase [Patescibacteria group bacterium]